MYRTYLNANVCTCNLSGGYPPPAGRLKKTLSLPFYYYTPKSESRRDYRTVPAARIGHGFFPPFRPPTFPTPVAAFLPRSFFRIATVLHKRDQDFMEIISKPFGMQRFLFSTRCSTQNVCIFIFKYYLYIYYVCIIYQAKTGHNFACWSNVIISGKNTYSFNTILFVRVTKNIILICIRNKF